MNLRLPALFLCALIPSLSSASGVTEFCLDGEFNLGARYQGTQPGVDEFVPTRWCVVTEDNSVWVLFRGSGKSNPDMYGTWTVALLPPDLVRIINANDPPDIEFQGAESLNEALRIRRIDPRRFIEKYQKEELEQLTAKIRNGRLHSVHTQADLPLRGRVPVVWQWSWSDPQYPRLALTVDGALFYRATGSWRNIDNDEARALWQATPGIEPVQVPGENWPARVNMQLEKLAAGIYLVRGVRTGFQHLVVDTDNGLVIADAPAGWVELHQLPPADLVPGLGISGLSERLIDFLAAELPDRPVRAVALTHAHDDHAGGARGFAAAGGAVYAPAEYEAFLESALNRDTLPPDRFAATRKKLDVMPVSSVLTLEDPRIPVSLYSLGSGPHGSAALGVLAGDYFFVSDVHVPRSSADEPREARAATECWFARWATDNLAPTAIVVNSHSAPQTPVSRLANYLESESCRALHN